MPISFISETFGETWCKVCSHANNLKFDLVKSSFCQWDVDYLHSQKISPEFTVLPMICALALCVGYGLYLMQNCQALGLSSTQAQWLYGWFTKLTLFKSTALEESNRKIISLFWESTKCYFWPRNVMEAEK